MLKTSTISSKPLNSLTTRPKGWVSILNLNTRSRKKDLVSSISETRRIKKTKTKIENTKAPNSLSKSLLLLISSNLLFSKNRTRLKTKNSRIYMGERSSTIWQLDRGRNYQPSSWSSMGSSLSRDRRWLIGWSKLFLATKWATRLSFWQFLLWTGSMNIALDAYNLQNYIW